MKTRTSLPTRPLSKEEVRDQLAVSWSRTIADVGRGSFADKLGCCSDTVGNALSGRTLPELHTALNSLLASPNALDEVLALYGFRLCPLQAEAANDLHTASGLGEVVTAICGALADGVRKHGETLDIADKLRPHMPALTALIREADELRGAA